jgi:predicted molibdopterin-dependent oxidoreductase YjgC
LRLADGETVTLAGERGELALRCTVSARVQEGVLFVPQYYDGGAVNALFPADGTPVAVRLRVAAPA